MIEVLSTYRFPLDEFPVFSLGIRLDSLASRFGWPVQTWDEDGLGTARGVACRLPSGIVFLMRELQHAVEHLGATGQDVYVDVGQVEARGVQSVAADILMELGLSECDVAWKQEQDADGAAHERAARARSYLEGKGRGVWRGC